MRRAQIQNLFKWSVVTCAFAPGCGGVEGAQDGIPAERLTGEGSVVRGGRRHR